MDLPGLLNALLPTCFPSDLKALHEKAEGIKLSTALEAVKVNQVQRDLYVLDSSILTSTRTRRRRPSLKGFWI